MNYDLLLLQVGPSYPRTHVQEKLSTPSLHVPPLLQGLSLQSSISRKQYFNEGNYIYVFQLRVGVADNMAIWWY